ncbi:MAG TPA: hypothetical protein VH351_07405 [Bryobacteraceae bacterium]|nr:hypothetical protein [Bryobacteraceae bacterium]
MLFAGVIFSGVSASALSIAIGAISVGLGIGILRRSAIAWKGALAYNAVGLFSVLVLLLPGYQSVLGSYQQELMPRRYALGLPNANPIGPHMQVISAVSSALLACAILRLLWQARPLFESRREPGRAA